MARVRTQMGFAAQYLRHRRATFGVRCLRFGAYRTSQTLFVLGSGASINRLDARQWSRIRSADSFGINNWIVHEFTPTYYGIEMPTVDPADVYSRTCENFLHNLDLAKSRYSSVPILYTRAHNRPFPMRGVPAELAGNLYQVPEVRLRGRSREAVRDHLAFAGRVGWLSPRARYDVGLTKRASLFRVVHFGVVGGYRNIVLCGVDLSTTAYFFQDDPAPYANRGCRLDHVAMLQRGAVHNTLDSDRGPLTIDVLLYLFAEQFLLPRGVRLFVASPSSALYPRIPLFDFEMEAHP